MIRARPTVLIAAAMAVSFGLVGHYLLGSRTGSDLDLSDLSRLERIAAERFENARGLSPCDPDERYVVSTARRKLIEIGEGDTELLAVTAPTFSEIEVTAFRPTGVKVFRFPGQTGFAPPSATWFSPMHQLIAETTLSASDYYAITMPISRHITHAMTARQYGHDGVTYYLSNGTDNCGFTWTPRGVGPAASIAEMLNEVSGPKTSITKLLTLAAAINDSDDSR